MPTYTTRLNVTKPASSENVNITTLNDDFDLFDSAVGATVGTSAAKPASAFSGRLWYETDTGRFKVNTAASASTAASWAVPFGSSIVDVVRDYGAVANSLAASATNNTAFALAASSGSYVYVPEGAFYGTFDLDPAYPRFFGAGYGKTTVAPASGHYFVDGNQAWGDLHIQGIRFSGGAGSIRNRYASANVNLLYKVFDNRFDDYTSSAISHNATDMPLWQITGNIFSGANDTSTIGVALSGLTDLCIVANNEFQKNKVHVKLGAGGNNAKIHRNDFVQYSAAASGNLRAAVWVVPQTSSTNAGPGLNISNNKFGNENQGSDDKRVLYADQGSGTYFGDKLPTIAADSTGYIVGHTIVDNFISGAAAIPVVYSTTPNIRGSHIGRNTVGGTAPTYVVQLRTTTTTPDPESSSNIIGPFLYADNNFTPFPVSNQQFIGAVVDPQGLLQTVDRPVSVPGGGRSSGYVNLLQQNINSFTLGGGATKSSITDAAGLADAAEVTFPGEIYTYVPTSALATDKPIWVEFDLLQGSSSALTAIIVQVGLDSASNGNHLRRTYTIDASWRTRRILIQSSSTSNSTLLKFKPATGSSGTKVKIGRVRMYHAYEPVLTDLELPFVTTGTSAPSAGGAGALPATPAGYVTVSINGTSRKIAYY